MDMNKLYNTDDTNSMKKIVKKITGYPLNKIVINSYTPDFIDYSIYRDLENDKRLGIPSIDDGRISASDIDMGE